MKQYSNRKRRIWLLTKYLVSKKHNDTRTASLCLREMRVIAGVDNYVPDTLLMPERAFVDYYKRKCLYPDPSIADLIKMGYVPIKNHFADEEELFNL